MPSEEDRATRQYPHRFKRWKYQLPWQPVGFTVCAGKGNGHLTRADRAHSIATTLRDSADDWACGLIAWCIIPDHVHVLVCATDGGGDVRSFIELFKHRSARRLSKLGMTTPVWQKRYWDRHVRSDEDLGNVIEYMLLNPVRKGLCERPEDWPHSEFCGYPWA